MKTKKKLHFMSKTKIGKVSFWIVIVSFLLTFFKTLNLLIPIPSPLLIGAICIFGITSVYALIKNRDYAISLFISASLGILGILFVIAEIAYPH